MATPLRATTSAYASVRRASRAICRLYDLVLVPTRLKATQFMILQIIAESGEIAHCDLANELAASVETLSRRLAGARREGLVSVHAGEHNKRMYSLAPKGRRVLEEARPYWQKAQLRLRSSLGESDWRMLLDFSRRVADAAIRAESLHLPNGNGHAIGEKAAPSVRKPTAPTRLL